MATVQTIQTKPLHEASDNISLIKRGMVLSPDQAVCSGNVLCSTFVPVKPAGVETIRPAASYQSA